MFNWLRGLCVKSSSPRQPWATRKARLELEGLESRIVTTVTPHGGAVLPNVEVQALYYGNNWAANPTLFNQTGQFDNFLNSTVHGSYMDMLANAGYGVGRGSSSGGKILSAAPGSIIQDSDIRNGIESAIKSSNHLEAPDANRLYIVFVEPNVELVANFNSNRHPGLANSVQDFAGYHGAFAGSDAQGRAASIRYAVVTTPGGTINNGIANSALGAIDGMTLAASHELAEAVTDPDIGYKAVAWYDDGANGEVGDIVAGQTVYLNGSAVQRISDKNDLAMTPSGATSGKAVSFVLKTDGGLYMHSGSDLTVVWTVLGGVAAVSDQGIDNNGHAMVDFVTTGGLAYEYHEGAGLVFLGIGAKSAVAGQGVSYVLSTDGSLKEYNDASKALTFLDWNVATISAGTDKTGVNMVDLVGNFGLAYELSDTSGWHFLGSNVRDVSAGRNGVSSILYTNGVLNEWSETTGQAMFLGVNVTQATLGTDQNGGWMVDLIHSDGSSYEYRPATGMHLFSNGATSISKARAGVVDVVMSSGGAFELNAGGSIEGWNFLTGNVRRAV